MTVAKGNLVVHRCLLVMDRRLRAPVRAIGMQPAAPLRQHS